MPQAKAGSAQGQKMTEQKPDPQKAFDKAMEAQQRGDFYSAANQYKELIRLYPNLTPAHANLGVVLTALGRYDEAIAEYNTALQAAPDDPALLLNLGLAYFKKGDFPNAAERFSALHKRSPSDTRITMLLANCELQQGHFTQTIALLEPIEKDNENDLDLEWMLGTAMFRVGRTLEGAGRIQKFALGRNSADAYQLAANLYLGLTFFEEARADAHAVLRINPRAPKAYVVLGMVADYAGDWDEAEKQFKQALEIDPKDLQARLQLSSVLLNARKFDEAREQIDRSLAQDPNAYGGKYLLGKLEHAQGNLEEAVKNLELAEKGDPAWLPPHVELTALYYALKRPEDGAREKKIVDELREKERERRNQKQIISPQVRVP